ncbi:4-hydroxy-tetrahydrodipicolinate synthase, partial [Herbaspirillum frisingense]
MSLHFKGIVPALITPLTPDEEIDEAGLRTLVDRLIEAGVHGLFVLGTNGEFISLSEAEKLRVARIAVDQARGRVPVIAGTGAYATREVIALNSKMQDQGIEAVSVITPYFNGATQAELFKHYDSIARATSLPVMLYTIPAKTGVQLNIDTVRRLSEIPNIRGIKDSGGDFDRLLQLINLKREDFAVFTGTDSMILWTLMAGGDGAVAATTNAVPSVVMSIWNNFHKGDIAAARQAQEALRPLRDAFALGTLPVVLKT